MGVVEITSENYEDEVAKEAKPVLLDFWASWCGPCKMISPIIDQVAEEVGEKGKVGKVNIDEQPELTRTFQVMSVPTLVVIKNGEVSKRTVGVQSKEEILELFK